MDGREKTVHATEKDSERVKELRKEFLSFQKRLKTEEIVCLDETGFKLNMTSVYGWAPKGERAIDSSPRKRENLITTIGAMSKDGS
jgi:hypothetical protein